MTLRAMSLLLPIALAVTACGSSATQAAGSPHDAGTSITDAPALDDAANEQPPCTSGYALAAIFTVVQASGAPIACDATLTIEDGGQGISKGPGQNSCSGGTPVTNIEGCPMPDGGNPPCAYALLSPTGGLVGGPFTVLVTQPGFSAVTVSDVYTGSVLCSGQTSPATHVTVTLEPAADAANGGED
jgi:hypothetical protein